MNDAWMDAHGLFRDVPAAAPWEDRRPPVAAS